MIKQRKHWYNLSPNPISISFSISAISSLSYQYSQIFTILSKSSRLILAIIKNRCTISEIHTIGLDITVHTSYKTVTSISLRCIGQFLIDFQPQFQDLLVIDQVIVNK